MKKPIIVIFLLAIILAGRVLYIRSRQVIHFPENSSSNPVTRTDSSSIDPCDPSLWNHIYNSYRLQIIKECITVTGTVDAVNDEKDGDEHILLRLDAGQENLLNDKNISEQKGDLVLEPVCVNEVTQADAIVPCSGYLNNVQIPELGDKVNVTGTYVLDKEHDWMEIHPVTCITITGKGKATISSHDPVVGYTAEGLPVYRGPRGGLYHYGKSGKKIYEKNK